MAVDISSEISSPFVSPRISLSDDVRTDDDGADIASAADFNFCTIQNSSDQISSADELFANGRILPLKINRIGVRRSDPTLAHKAAAIDKPQLKTAPDATQNAKKKRLIEFLSASFDTDEENKPSTAAAAGKSFWHYRRSSSLNSDDRRSSFGGGLLRSLHFLTRSNSTGSTAPPVRKVMQKQQSMKESSNSRSDPSRPAPSDLYYPYNSPSGKPSLKKSPGKAYGGGNGARIFSPVLNFNPPVYIARGTVNFLGMGSFFCSKKSPKKKK